MIRGGTWVFKLIPRGEEAPVNAKAEILDEAGIRRALVRIAHEIVERNESIEDLYLVAIPNGGVPLARAIAAQVKEIAGVDLPVGILDTTLYRDDLSARTQIRASAASRLQPITGSRRRDASSSSMPCIVAAMRAKLS